MTRYSEWGTKAAPQCGAGGHLVKKPAVSLLPAVKELQRRLVLFCLAQVLHQTFPQHTFLMNGLIHGVKVRKIPSRLPGESAQEVALPGLSQV